MITYDQTCYNFTMDALNLNTIDRRRGPQQFQPRMFNKIWKTSYQEMYRAR